MHVYVGEPHVLFGMCNGVMLIAVLPEVSEWLYRPRIKGGHLVQYA